MWAFVEWNVMMARVATNYFIQVQHWWTIVVQQWMMWSMLFPIRTDQDLLMDSDEWHHLWSQRTVAHLPNLTMMSNHAGEFVVQESLLWWLHLGEGHIEHIRKVIGVELGKNGAEVHRRIMINAGDAVLNLLDLEFFLSHISFFPCDKHEKSPQKNRSTLGCRNFIETMIDNKSFCFQVENQLLNRSHSSQCWESL